MKFTLFVHMKKLLTLSLLIVSIGTNAQIQVTDSLIDSFLKTKITDISQKLYLAALNKKVNVYWNDSFNTPIPLNDLKTVGSYEYYIASEEDLADTTHVIPFEFTTDLRGFTTVYTSSTDVKHGTISYQLQGIGPMYTLIAGEGIELGLTQLFLAKRSSFKKALSKSEVSILSSIISQTSQFGDFRIVGEKYYEATPIEVATENAFRSIQSSKQMVYHRTTFTENTIQLSQYNQHLNSLVMSRIASEQEPKYKVEKYLFQDLKLTKPYTNPGYELRTGLHTQYGDETGELKDTFIEVNNEFFEKYEYSVHKVGGQFILDFTIEQYGYTYKNGHVYMSFDDVKALYPKHDRIVMEAFFNYLFEGR